MLTASGNFAVQMGSRRIRVAGKFTMALPDTDYLDFSKVLKTISLDAQNTTDLPDGVRDTVGFSSQGGSAVLTGKVGRLKHQTVAWLLNPDEPTSPMYRQQVKGCIVTFSWGVRVRGSSTPELLQTFAGRVTTLHHDHVAGSVTIGLVDLSVDWTDLPEIPAVVTAPPYNAGLTSEFAMDNIVRYFEGASSWPAQRPQCVLAVGMRSSMWPEVGSLAAAATIGGDQLIPRFAPGAFGTALNGLTSTPTTTGYDNLVYILSSGNLGTRAFVEFWVDGIDASSLHFLSLAPSNNTFNEIYMKVKSTGITLGVVGFSGNEFTWTTPIDGNPHYIAASIVVPAVGGTVSSATLYLDGASQATGTLTWGGPRDAVPMDSLWLSTDGHGTIEALQVTTETAPAINYPFTPVAVLDPSLNPLTVVPEITAGTQGRDELQTIAAAEGGYAYRDGQGVFRFLNRNSVGHASVGRTLSSLVSLKGLETDQGGSTEYDAVNAPLVEWNIGAPGLLWTLTTKKRIGAGQTVSWVQTLGDGVLAAKLDTAAAVLPDGHAFDDGNTWYRASADSAGVNPFGGTLTVTVQQVTSGSVRISVVNKSTQAAYLVSPSTFSETDLLGQPALWIGGIPAIQGDEATVTASIGAGTTPLALSSNSYWQDHDALVAYLQHVLAQVYVSIRDFTNVAIVPDARIEIADREVLQDLVRSKVNEYAQIWGSSINFDFTKGSESLEQTLNVRALAGPDGWIGEVAGRSEGEQTTWGY